jgi:hypothetical protein
MEVSELGGTKEYNPVSRPVWNFSAGCNVEIKSSSRFQIFRCAGKTRPAITVPSLFMIFVTLVNPTANPVTRVAV